MGMSLSQWNNAAQTVFISRRYRYWRHDHKLRQFCWWPIFVSILSSTFRSKLGQDIPGLDVSSISRYGSDRLVEASAHKPSTGSASCVQQRNQQCLLLCTWGSGLCVCGILFRGVEII